MDISFRSLFVESSLFFKKDIRSLRIKHIEKIERKGASTPASFWGVLFMWRRVEDGAL